MFIHEKNNWTRFYWDEGKVSLLLEKVNQKQGFLSGVLSTLCVDDRLMAMGENLTRDVVYSSEIEGIQLNINQVRSSIARRLGIENVKYTSPSHYIESVVSVMMDAVQHYNRPLSKEKLCAWQAAFFPMGVSDGNRIEVGVYRTHEEHIISGMFGREKIHYIAPGPAKVEPEMEKFLKWFDTKDNTNSIIRSAIAHFWFVCIHPFEDGNGRLARILSEMMLARGEQSEFRYYNISSQINKDKKRYYEILECAQRGEGNITEWLTWYILKLIDALNESESLVKTTLNKSFFWQRNSNVTLSDRQRKILNLFLDGYEAKITSKSWASLAKCSQDTALRDINDLVEKEILSVDIPGAKRPSFSIVYTKTALTEFITEVEIKEENGIPYLVGLYKSSTPIKERLLRLDAERYLRGDLPLESLLTKYCAYLRINSRR